MITSSLLQLLVVLFFLFILDGLRRTSKVDIRSLLVYSSRILSGDHVVVNHRITAST